MNSLRGTQLLLGLRDFEATARCGSFAAAGLELGVSASAVSQQVKSLEKRLGRTLFDRHPQSLSLTLPGYKLLAALTGAFDLIESSLLALRPTQDTVVLSMPAVFAGNWFLPRMLNFRANYPRFEVLPRSSGTVLEPSLIGVSASVRHGRAGWGNLDCRFLFNEVLLPACSPQYFSETSTHSGLENSRLLVSEHRPSIWDEWAFATGKSLGSTRATVFGDDSLVIQAAINGHGVALVDCNLISHQLQLRLLTPLVGAPSWETGDGWHLVFEEQMSFGESLTALIDWMLHEAATDTSSSSKKIANPSEISE